MSNPYSPPSQQGTDLREISTQIRGPATAMLVVSCIAVTLGAIALVFDIGLIVGGFVGRLQELNESPIPKQTQLTIRIVWGIALLIASSFVLYGAIQMRNLRSYGIARMAAVVCMIPLLGPCCIAGIPFGIWAFLALGKPGVRAAFDSRLLADARLSS